MPKHQLTLSPVGQHLYDVARKRLGRRPFIPLVTEQGTRFPIKLKKPVARTKWYRYQTCNNKGGDIINLLMDGREIEISLDAKIALTFIFPEATLDYIEQLWQGWDYGKKTQIEMEAVVKHLPTDNAKNGFRDGYIMFQRISAKRVVPTFKTVETRKPVQPSLTTLFAIN